MACDHFPRRLTALMCSTHGGTPCPRICHLVLVVPAPCFAGSPLRMLNGSCPRSEQRAVPMPHPHALCAPILYARCSSLTSFSCRFYEVEVFKTTTVDFFSPILGPVFVSRGFKVLKFAINALTALGNEMFRLTNETRGALLLMMMFFYSAYVLGATLYVETAGNSDLCLSMGMCTWTLVRLTFFDGDGLDFAYYLTSDHRILFFIIMVYMCITSFGILNGLVGIFGTALARASHLAFESEDDDREGSLISGEEEEDDEKEEPVEPFKEGEEPIKTSPRAMAMTEEMKKSVKDMLRGASSRFAIEHFQEASNTAAAAAATPYATRPRAGEFVCLSLC